MLSDKLEERAKFVETRDKLERCYAAMIQDYAPKGAEGAFAARLNSLMALNSELTSAPILYTLRSAAEVGFAHAQITPQVVPAGEPDPKAKVQPAPVNLNKVNGKG